MARDHATQTLRFAVGNLSCGGCAARAEGALAAVPGVLRARVNFATRRADVTMSGADTGQLSAAMDHAGYPISPIAPAQNDVSDGDDPRALRNAFLLALVLTLPVFLSEMLGHAIPAFHHWLFGTFGQQTIRLGQLILTAAVLIGPGRVFFERGLPALARGAPEMNSLVALGAGTAWLWSALVTLAPDAVPVEGAHVYFEAAAVIVTLILLGRWLEARARGQAGAAIAGLMALTPDTALRLRDGAPDEEVALEAIFPGDHLRLRPGDRVPVDGVVVDGASDLDEAMLTGEPIPVAKSPGDPVSAGTMNGAGTLVLRAQAVGADTALGRIVAMVEDAQATRLPVQALINRVTLIFVPVVLVIALLAGAVWFAAGAGDRAIVALVSVLIIACPCAMGLATPVSILAGTGRAAELGVLFRRGEALQALGKVDLVAFDKTGTLSIGRPELTSFDGTDTDRVIAAAVEAGSDHPLAQAILRDAQGRGLTLPNADDFRNHPGGGVTARVGEQDVALGNAAFLRGLGLSVPDHPATSTEVLLAVGQTYRATFRFSDPAKPEAAAAIARLRDAGKRTAILSGDAQAAVDGLADPIGITDAQGGLSPGDKQAAVAAWQAQGLRVAFVGDGINDAPVLAAADVGVALGTGTDIAMEAADVVLTAGQVTGLPDAVQISRATMANIRQNLVWAFGYNVALIPVAAGLLVPFGGPMLNPMLGAGAMAASSVLVVVNALRLRHVGRRA
ncbi:heavy metal translocating P-type ATPase [Gymnodinialimonas sp. 2305UL16-5]|uniref:heavy metal translocating P-type ATPase n=1 Tax=Gymnodinialimonas mytili TaxID=3126503 RepID=UPI0030AB5B81